MEDVDPESVEDLIGLTPGEMTRAQLVRAIKHWRSVSPEDELHDYVDLILAAEELLARETYEDGTGQCRCVCCKGLVTPRPATEASGEGR